MSEGQNEQPSAHDEQDRRRVSRGAGRGRPSRGYGWREGDAAPGVAADGPEAEDRFASLAPHNPPPHARGRGRGRGFQRGGSGDYEADPDFRGRGRSRANASRYDERPPRSHDESRQGPPRDEFKEDRPPRDHQGGRPQRDRREDQEDRPPRDYQGGRPQRNWREDQEDRPPRDYQGGRQDRPQRNWREDQDRPSRDYQGGRQGDRPRREDQEDRPYQGRRRGEGDSQPPADSRREPRSDAGEFRRAPPPREANQDEQRRRRVTRPPRSESQEREVAALFEVRHRQKGINFDNYNNIAVAIMPDDVPPAQSFADFLVEEPLRENLVRCGYTNPTPVQKYGIPVTFKGKDIMACAQTGSGKTAAFLIPIINHVLIHGVSLAVRRCLFPIGVIMAPTRELASQIYDEARKLCFKTDVLSAVVYGGIDYNTQMAGLECGCDILVATPGRLKDLFDRRKVSFERVKFLVLDEADRMLDMGFEEQIDYLVAGNVTDMPIIEHRQTMLYSATFPKPIQNLAKSYLKRDHYLLTVGRVGSTTKNITQRVVWCEDREKRSMMMKLLYGQLQSDLVLIFVETKNNANALHQFLNSEGIPCATIHGDRKQWEREDALASFKNGTTPVLVATDVASRGLDIPNVAHVIQYDLPTAMDDYIHRIGRTARAGNSGVATAFFNDSNRQLAGELLSYLTEHEQEVPEWLESAAIEALSGAGRRGGGGGRRGGGGSTRSTGLTAPHPGGDRQSAPLAQDWEAALAGKKPKRAAPQAGRGPTNDGGF